MLVALCSDKGSPGVTTTALALAAAWGSMAICVEVDPAGGDLALRVRTDAGVALAEKPTALTLATAARSAVTAAGPAAAQAVGPGGVSAGGRVDDHLVARCAQQVNSQVLVVPGFMAAEQCGRVSEWTTAATAMAASRFPVFADLGRLWAGSPVLPVAAAADVVALVIRPEAQRADSAMLARVRDRLDRLVPALAEAGRRPPVIATIVVTRSRWAAADVADVGEVLRQSAAAPFLVGVASVNLDASGVETLEAGGWTSRFGSSKRTRSDRSRQTGRGTGRMSRSGLATSAEELARWMSEVTGIDRFDDPVGSDADESHEPEGIDGDSRSGPDGNGSLGTSADFTSRSGVTAQSGWATASSNHRGTPQ